jgi:hypothetical protein
VERRKRIPVGVKSLQSSSFERAEETKNRRPNERDGKVQELQSAQASGLLSNASSMASVFSQSCALECIDAKRDELIVVSSD